MLAANHFGITAGFSALLPVGFEDSAGDLWGCKLLNKSWTAEMCFRNGLSLLFLSDEDAVGDFWGAQVQSL